MYVQTLRLKIVAVVYVQLLNSRSPEQFSLVTFYKELGNAKTTQYFKITVRYS